MPEHSSPHDIYAALRQLSFKDPKAARHRFRTLLEGEKDLLDSVLEIASGPGEGRVRQLIANAVKSEPDSGKVIDFLLRWHKVETDEFAKRAISAAISGVDKPAALKIDRSRTLVDPRLVDTYRYVTGRIRHQMNNALLGPAETLMRLSNMVALIGDVTIRSDLETMIAEAKDSLRSVGRVVAFVPEDDYFDMRGIAIIDWLSNMNLEYGRKYRPVKLSIATEVPSKDLCIQANDYWLDTIFWNIWTNAQQAVEGSCEIRVHAKKVGRRVRLTIVDNGDGFPKDMREIAFQEKYSRKGAGRGRGLLEIQDAVERLHGTVQLVNVEDTHRIRVQFPLEES